MMKTILKWKISRALENNDHVIIWGVGANEQKALRYISNRKIKFLVDTYSTLDNLAGNKIRTPECLGF